MQHTDTPHSSMKPVGGEKDIFFAYKDSSLPWEESGSLWSHYRVHAPNSQELKQVSIVEKKELHCNYSEISAQLKQAPPYKPQSPGFLQPTVVVKPWGFEQWWSGIEQRGISHITPHPKAEGVRLSTYLDFFGEAALESPPRAPILLKTLSPFPHPIRGNLYYELHLQKSEVYIVCRIQGNTPKDTHPSSATLYVGVSQDKRSSYASDDAFRHAFAQALCEYETVQQHISASLEDFYRRAQAQCAQRDFSRKKERWWWQQQVQNSEELISTSLKHKRAQLKRRLMEFFHPVEVKVGDVISIPPRVPHSLQHGIEVIEFQSPSYERTILAFDQKVWTQDHWDIQDAMQHMCLHPHRDHLSLDHLCSSEPQAAQRFLVATFADFKVFLLTVPPNTSLQLSGEGKHSLLKVLAGTAVADFKGLQQTLITTEYALFLPAALTSFTLQHSGACAEKLKVLWALSCHS